MIEVNRKDFTWRIVDEIPENAEEAFLVPRINIDEYLIRHISIAVTNKCNLSCDYCYKSVKYDGCIKEIPYETIEKFINDFYSIDVCGNRLETIQLIGGEPTLHNDFLDICRLIVDKGLGLRISTNGTHSKMLCSDEMLEMCKRGRVEFRISVDEIPEKESKSLRRGSSKKIYDNIAYLAKESCDLSVKSVVTKKNIDDLPEILDYLYHAGVKNFSFSSLYDLGNASSKDFYKENYVPDVEIYKVLLSICKEHPEYSSMLKANIIFHILTSVFVKKAPYYFTKFYTYVNYDGKIYSQDQLIHDEYCIGNIYDYSIHQVVNNLRAMKQTHEIQKRGCMSCLVYPYCTRGNYGELYRVDNTLQEDFPTCSDMRELVEYIITNCDESLNYFKALFSHS